MQTRHGQPLATHHAWAVSVGGTPITPPSKHSQGLHPPPISWDIAPLYRPPALRSRPAEPLPHDDSRHTPAPKGAIAADADPSFNLLTRKGLAIFLVVTYRPPWRLGVYCVMVYARGAAVLIARQLELRLRLTVRTTLRGPRAAGLEYTSHAVLLLAGESRLTSQQAVRSRGTGTDHCLTKPITLDRTD